MAQGAYADMLAGGHGVDFAGLAAKLPTGMDPETKAARKRMFLQFDVNANGFLSLAEVDKAVGSVLGSEELAACKPVLARAFRAAKDAGSTRTNLSPDYVEKSEFRRLLVYLRTYFELYLAYNRLDSSDDRRLSLPEFRAGVGLLAQWGIDVPEADVEAEFASIDANCGGIVLYDEFCDWALRKGLDLEDDDDWVDDAPRGGGAAAAAAAPDGARRTRPAAADPSAPRRRALLVGARYYGGAAPLERSSREMAPGAGPTGPPPTTHRLLRPTAPTRPHPPAREHRD